LAYSPRKRGPERSATHHCEWAWSANLTSNKSGQQKTRSRQGVEAKEKAMNEEKKGAGNLSLNEKG